MDEVINNTLQQVQAIIRAKFLNPKLFMFVKMNDLTLRVNHGKRNVDIAYNYGHDLYTVTVHRIKRELTVQSDTTEDVYVEDLPNFIQ